MDNTFPVIGHKSNEGGVPLVSYFGESGAATGHENLTHPVFKLLHGFFIYFEKGLGSDFLSVFIL